MSSVEAPDSRLAESTHTSSSALQISATLRPHPPGKVPAVIHGVPPYCKRDEASQPGKAMRVSSHPAQSPYSTSPSVEEELAELSEKLSRWKEKRLAELQEESDQQAAIGEVQPEAAMERRMQQRREAERTRVQQRLRRLLDTVEPQLERCLQSTAFLPLADNEASTADAPVLVSPTPTASPVVETPQTRVPAVQTLVACDRWHLIGYQVLSMEEREARSRIEQLRLFTEEVMRLVSDEAEFRACLESWEDSLRARLVACASVAAASASGNSVEPT